MKIRQKLRKLKGKKLLYFATALMLVVVFFFLPLVKVSTPYVYKKTENGLIYRDFVILSYVEIHHETNWFNPFDKEKWVDTVSFFLADNKEIRDMLKEYPLYKVSVKKLDFNMRTENEKYASVTVSCLGASRSFEYPSDGSYSFEIRKEVEKTEIIVEFNIVLKPYGWSAKSAKITISNLKLYVTVYFGNPNNVTEEVTENVNETQTTIVNYALNNPSFGIGQHFDFWYMTSWLNYAVSLSVIAIVILAIYVLKGDRSARRGRKSKR